MASFQKRGKTWQFTISRMVNGKQRPIRKGGFKTKKEAQIAAAQIEAELHKGVIPNLTPIPFDEYFENWLNTYKKDIARNTLDRYKSTLKTIKQYFGGVPIQKITKRTYQNFLNKYGETHAKSSTRKLNTHIRACVKDAIDEGYIRTDFTRGAVLTGKSGKKKEEKYLNYEESKRLLKALYEKLDDGLIYYLLLLGLTSGMRFGEMVGLTRKDFNFKNNTIIINKTWGYIGKMHEGWGPTKNEQSNRIITMDPRTMQAFKELFNKTPDNVLRLVFYSPYSKYKVISNNAANKALGKILKELDIEPISVHGLRHTHASILLYEGASINYISERLGHSDINTTLTTYAHVLKELRQRDEQLAAEVFKKMYV